MIRDKKLGLALSGGGYRAAAFHLGTLRKLNELGLLDQVDVLSTISGGSIAGTYYALNKNDFMAFSSVLEKALKRSVIRKIIFSIPFLIRIFLLLASWVSVFFLLGILGIAGWGFAGSLFIVCSLILIICFQFRFIDFTKLKIKAYQDVFFGSKTLNDLPDRPKMAINATNLETGTLFTYSKTKVSDSSYEYPKDGGASIKFKADEISLAVAVASSTAVPVPFNPVKIDKRYFVNASDFTRVNPSLVDGGLYDNQGIHKITQRGSSYECDIIICSDGSQPFSYQFKGGNSISVLYRATDVMMRKIKNLQFIRDVYDSDREIAYFSLDWEYNKSIAGFVREAKEGNLDPAILLYHKINIDDYKMGTTFDSQRMIEYMKVQIGYNSITSKGLTHDQVVRISKIGTNLTTLSAEQIHLLSSHAAVLTELQIKLFCPSLSIQ